MTEPADAPPALPPWVARSIAGRDTRIKELIAEVDRLWAIIAELRRQPGPAVPAVAGWADDDWDEGARS
jgi:hypothetical protein